MLESGYLFSLYCVSDFVLFQSHIMRETDTKSNDIASAAAKLEKRLASWLLNRDLNFKGPFDNNIGKENKNS